MGWGVDAAMGLFLLGGAMMMVKWLCLKMYLLEIHMKLYRWNIMSGIFCKIILGQEVSQYRKQNWPYTDHWRRLVLGPWGFVMLSLCRECVYHRLAVKTKNMWHYCTTINYVKEITGIITIIIIAIIIKHWTSHWMLIVITLLTLSNNAVKLASLANPLLRWEKTQRGSVTCLRAHSC